MTTFAASTIPAFTAALKAGLEARPGFAKTIVTDGPASADVAEAADELVELLDVEPAEQDPHALNRTTQPRRELCEMKVLITVVWVTSEKQTEVNERAFALLDEFNQLLRGDPYLAANYTGPGRVYGARITTIHHTKRTNANNTKREAGLEVGVRWEGRI